jgi:hypothetical protein
MIPCDCCKQDNHMEPSLYLYPYRLFVIKQVKAQGIYLCARHAELLELGHLPSSPLLRHYRQHAGIGRFALPIA